MRWVDGSSYGAPTGGEVELAERIRDAYPSMQMLRMTSSGTEAVMGALRGARGFTGRDLVVKFEGASHGGADYLLVKAGSGADLRRTRQRWRALRDRCRDLPGVAVERRGGVRRTLRGARGREIAALILEPVVGNMGCVPPASGFLELLRDAHATSAGALLVFDEANDGQLSVRLRRGSSAAMGSSLISLHAREDHRWRPSGPEPTAVGARSMQRVSPLGPGVHQAGTLSGNPLAVAAGLATLALLREPERVRAGWRPRARRSKACFVKGAAKSAVVSRSQVQRVGSMLTPVLQRAAPSRTRGTTRNALRSQTLRPLPSQHCLEPRCILAALAVRSGLCVTRSRRRSARATTRGAVSDREARAMSTLASTGWVPPISLDPTGCAC